MNTLKNIISELHRFKGRVNLSLFFSLLTILTGVGLIAASGYLITWAALQPPILDMILILVAVRFFGISRAVFRYTERLFSHDLTFRILQKLRVGFYNAVEPVLPAKAIRYRSGDLLSRFSDDVDQLQEFYLRVISPAFSALFFILLTTVVTAWFSLTLSAAILLLMVINVFAIPFLIRKKAGDITDHLADDFAGLSQFMNDHVQGASDLLHSGSHKNWMTEGEIAIENISDIQKRRTKAFSLESGFYTAVSHASLPASFLILLPLVLSGELSGLLMVAVVLGVFTAFEAFEPIGNAVQHAYETRESAERLDDITSVKADEKPKKLTTVFKPQDASISMMNVSFSYNKDRVLRHIDLVIGAGEHVLLTGPSGSGKSTISHLLVKWFEPDDGDILIGDQSIRMADGASVRKFISVVGQHTRLFNTSLRNNLLIANPDATDRDLIEALTAVRFDDAFAKLPNGLDTQVGELGLRLSGGERQRVAIARALLKDTPIWILDEPLSNLGRVMADDISEAIAELTKHKTVLHITHDKSRLNMADRFYAMSDGKIWFKRPPGPYRVSTSSKG